MCVHSSWSGIPPEMAYQLHFPEYYSIKFPILKSTGQKEPAPLEKLAAAIMVGLAIGLAVALLGEGLGAALEELADCRHSG